MYTRLRRMPGLLAVASAAFMLVVMPSVGAAQQPGHALGIDTTSFDRSVRPQDDFNRFVNGKWIDRTEIPADRSSFGSFDALREQSDAWIREIVEEAASADAAHGTNLQKVGDFYAAFMDSATIESRGIAPLAEPMDVIKGLTSSSQLPDVLARMERYGVVGPVGVGVGQDQKNSSAYIVSVGQSGLGLPDKSYYENQDEKFVQLRAAYVDYLTKILSLANQPDAAGAAQRIVDLETKIADVQWDRAKNRDRDATYNKMSVADLDARMPDFAWSTFLGSAGMGAADNVVVRQPDYLDNLDGILASTPVSTWREYLTAKLLSGYAGELPAPYVNANFDFYGKVLSGQQEQRPRWKRGVGEVQGALGEAVGQLYVERHFQPEAKARMDQLVKNLLAAFKAGIEDLDWMSPATKAEAQAKLAKFTVKIGYPDKWQDYSDLDVRPGDLVGNVMRANAWAYDDMVGRLGGPVDRTRWGMTPQTVNAYYNSVNNEIVFPAAILQPPFFNVEADDAVNYGGIGAVIGHEISHGFDDQGRKSDGDGNLRDWWTAADAQAFEAKTDMLGAQYASYEPLPGMHINGQLTMGENIGDLSGLAVAYRAYHMSLNGKEAPVIDGFTGDQRFYMGWAQVWRTKMRDEALRNQLMTNPHSPGDYRAFIPLTNLAPFYKAFDVKEGDGMWRAPDERVKIW